MNLEHETEGLKRSISLEEMDAQLEDSRLEA